jgi:hypothetical protein
LCLLDRSWDAARADLGAVGVRLTLVAGEIAAGSWGLGPQTSVV